MKIETNLKFSKEEIHCLKCDLGLAIITLNQQDSEYCKRAAESLETLRNRLP